MGGSLDRKLKKPAGEPLFEKVSDLDQNVGSGNVDERLNTERETGHSEQGAKGRHTVARQHLVEHGEHVEREGQDKQIDHEAEQRDRNESRRTRPEGVVHRFLAGYKTVFVHQIHRPSPTPSARSVSASRADHSIRSVALPQ